MPDEIDLMEGVCSIMKDHRIPVDHYAMFLNGKLIYAGQIGSGPVPQTGCVVLVHPDDFDEIYEMFKNTIN